MSARHVGLQRSIGTLLVVLIVLSLPAARADQGQLDTLIRSAVQLDRGNRTVEALEKAREAVAHAEQLYGRSHPQVARALTVVAALYRKAGRTAEAAAAENRVRAISNGRERAQADAERQRQQSEQERARAAAAAAERQRQFTTDRDFAQRSATHSPPGNAPPPAGGSSGGSAGVPRVAVEQAPAPARPPAAPPLPPKASVALPPLPSPPRSVAISPAPPVIASAPGAPAAPKAVQLDPKEFAEVPVFYGTNRMRGPTTAAKNGVQLVTYSSQPTPDLELGNAVVSVPRQGREQGEIPRPRAATFWRAAETEDPKFHFMLVSVSPLGRDVFVRQVDAALLRSSGTYKDQAFVFVHGFNVPFEDALYRTAQIAYDLEFQGVPFLYSWPTLEGSFGYVGARDRAMASRSQLRNFLDLISRETKAKRIHLIAHSMGTWPLLDVLREIAQAEAQSGKPPRFQEVVLAAPDMDRDNFAALARQICPERTPGSTRCAGGSAQGLTIYASNNDRALIASVRLASGIDRAGLFDEKRPFVLRHIDTIDVSNADTSFFSYNHSQPLERAKLLQDIGLLLKDSARPPNTRLPIYETKRTTDGGEYWRYR